MHPLPPLLSLLSCHSEIFWLVAKMIVAILRHSLLLCAASQGCCCVAWCLWALKDIQNNHKSGRVKHPHPHGPWATAAYYTEIWINVNTYRITLFLEEESHSGQNIFLDISNLCFYECLQIQFKMLISNQACVMIQSFVSEVIREKQVQMSDFKPQTLDFPVWIHELMGEKCFWNSKTWILISVVFKF